MLALVIACLLITLYRSRNYTREIGSFVRYPRCDSLFHLSNLRQSWERDSSPASCQRKIYSLRSMHRCVDNYRRNGWTKKKLKVVLIGDSRVDMLQRHSTKIFGLQISGKCANISQPEDDPLSECVYDITKLKRTGTRHRLIFRLYSQRSDSHLEFESFWRVYMDKAFHYKLYDLIDVCRQRSVDCPSMVVVGDGPWYARRFDLTSSASAVDWTLKYRNDLMDLSVTLRQLALYTKVLWKLDEPEVPSRPGHSFSIETPTFSVLHAYAYNILYGVPNVIVWSSSLPTDLNFYHRVCSLVYRSYHTVLEQTLRKECDDYVHAGYSVVFAYVQTIVDYLCRHSAEDDDRRDECCTNT